MVVLPTLWMYITLPSCTLTNGSGANYCTLFILQPQNSIKTLKMVLVKKNLKKKKILCNYIAASVCRGETVSAEPRALWVVSLLTPCCEDAAPWLLRLPHSSLKWPHAVSALHFSFSLQYACLCYRKMFSSEGVVFKKLCWDIILTLKHTHILSA